MSIAVVVVLLKNTGLVIELSLFIFIGEVNRNSVLRCRFFRIEIEFEKTCYISVRLQRCVVLMRCF